MLGRTVGVVAAICALSASAFLLPPGIASATDGAPNLALSLVSPKKQEFSIPCAECAFPETQTSVNGEVKEAGADAEEDGWFWVQGGAKDVLLELTVSEDGEHLRVGKKEVYPLQLDRVLTASEPLRVKQVSRDTHAAEVEAGDARFADLKVTSHGIGIDDEVSITSEGDHVVTIRLMILELEGQMMELPEVLITLLRTSAGELLIMNVDTVFDTPVPEGLRAPGLDSPAFSRPPFHHGRPHGPPDSELEDIDFPPPPFHPGRLHLPHKECDVLPAPLCRLKNMLDSKIDASMGPPHFRKTGGGCRGRKGFEQGKVHHGPPGLLPPGMEDRPKHHHGRPHHMRPHGGHHHHRHGHFWRHHFLHAFAKGVVAVLIPVMAGITVGMSVSLLGLIIGRLIGFLWIRLVRGGKRGSVSVAQYEVTLEEGEDKAMLAEMEAPPVYEDAPAYEGAEKEVR